ncbi:MAG: hypothetical protein H0W46_08970, partial [Acidimicrobiia bacterium]|nr:hypothetical protein [Acidimicrobiia bacterium]
AVAVDQAAWYRGQAVEQEGLAAVWSDWAARAEATANLLAAAVDAGLQPAEEQEVVLRVLGPGITRAAPLLEAAGFTVSTVDVEADAGD